MSYLSGQYLIDHPGPAFRFLWPVVLFFLLMGMVGTTYCYFVSETHNKRAPITRMARRVQSIAWTLSVIGLLLVGFRLGDAQIPLLESRLLMYLVMIGFLVLAVYVAWFLRFVLPEKEAAYEQTLLRRQYHPRSRRRR